MLPGTLGIFLPIIIPLCMCLPMLIKWHRLNGGVVVDIYKCMSVEETHVDDYIRLAFRVCYHFAMVHDVRLKLAPFLVCMAYQP